MGEEVKKAKKEEKAKAAKAVVAEAEAEKKKQEVETAAKKAYEAEKKAALEKKQKAAAATEAAKNAPAVKKEEQGISERNPVRRSLAGGLKVEIFRAGNKSGAVAKRGRKVKVKYAGRLASNGKQFDKGTIEFRLGVGEVIRGWDDGVADMQVGEKRRLMVPAQLGYGARGAPPDIPRNAALVFDVELLGVK